jgi:hypothetical protein
VIARGEIESRDEAGQAERDATLDRELQMLARMRVKYPRVPVELEAEFVRRLNAGGFTWGSWDETVEWLEATEWFTQHSDT